MKTWHDDMSDKETADLAYWERNMLALRYADGWYNDDVPDPIEVSDPYNLATSAAHVAPIVLRLKPRYQTWRRVLTLDGGEITFHIPDDFDVGNLPQVSPNWDGHTTEEKWQRIMNLSNE